ncbi:MAG: hypothetical protein IMZ61_16440, partial [Planctomycetes bacterium]|nr:hypothetical protein [Planctomycetota bacterium]
VYKFSKNAEAAYKALEKYYSPEYQSAIAAKNPGVLSSRYSVLEDPAVRRIHPEAEWLLKLSQKGYVTGRKKFVGFDASWEIFSVYIHKVILGQMTASDAVKAAQEEIEASLKE